MPALPYVMRSRQAPAPLEWIPDGQVEHHIGNIRGTLKIPLRPIWFPRCPYRHRDIDTQHHAQQSLTMAQEAMSRSARILSMAEMAASIAHELNQPTTALVSHAYACRDWAAMNPPNLDKVRSTAEKLVLHDTQHSEGS